MLTEPCNVLHVYLCVARVLMKLSGGNWRSLSMNLASWRTGIIFNKNPAWGSTVSAACDYSCAYWFWSIAQSRTAHHKQAGDFSSTAAMKSLCFMEGWDQLNNQYRIKEETAGGTWNLFLSCHRYCGIVCLSKWNNNREASGQIVCFPSLGESAFFLLSILEVADPL